MLVGIAMDRGGSELKERFKFYLSAAGHVVVDAGARELNPVDDYPGFVMPTANLVADDVVDCRVTVCGGGLGDMICANRIPGVRAWSA